MLTWAIYRLSCATADIGDARWLVGAWWWWAWLDVVATWPEAVAHPLHCTPVWRHRPLRRWRHHSTMRRRCEERLQTKPYSTANHHHQHYAISHSCMRIRNASVSSRCFRKKDLVADAEHKLHPLHLELVIVIIVRPVSARVSHVTWITQRSFTRQWHNSVANSWDELQNYST